MWFVAPLCRLCSVVQLAQTLAYSLARHGVPLYFLLSVSVVWLKCMHCIGLCLFLCRNAPCPIWCSSSRPGQWRREQVRISCLAFASSLLSWCSCLEGLALFGSSFACLFGRCEAGVHVLPVRPLGHCVVDCHVHEPQGA